MIFRGYIITEQEKKVEVTARAGALTPQEAQRVRDELTRYCGWKNVRWS